MRRISTIATFLATFNVYIEYVNGSPTWSSWTTISECQTRCRLEKKIESRWRDNGSAIKNILEERSAPCGTESCQDLRVNEDNSGRVEVLERGVWIPIASSSNNEISRKTVRQACNITYNSRPSIANVKVIPQKESVRRLQKRLFVSSQKLYGSRSRYAKQNLRALRGLPGHASQSQVIKLLIDRIEIRSRFPALDYKDCQVDEQNVSECPLKHSQVALNDTEMLYAECLVLTDKQKDAEILELRNQLMISRSEKQKATQFLQACNSGQENREDNLYEVKRELDEAKQLQINDRIIDEQMKGNIICGGALSKYNKIVTKVIGGKKVRNAEWMARIGSGSNKEYTCGASILSSRYVLTAAHCFDDIEQHIPNANQPTVFKTDELFLSVGHANPKKSEKVQIELVTMHEDYSVGVMRNDIAVIKTSTNIKLGYIVDEGNRMKYRAWPICLPVKEQCYSTNTKVNAFGWGLFNKDNADLKEKAARVLRGIPLEIKNYRECQYNNTTPAIVCAGSDQMKDVCRGDSGGPITIEENEQEYIYGIVSYGQTCKITLNDGVSRPGAYTRVTSHLTWIEKHTPGLYDEIKRFPSKAQVKTFRERWPVREGTCYDDKYESPATDGQERTLRKFA